MDRHHDWLRGRGAMRKGGCLHDTARLSLHRPLEVDNRTQSGRVETGSRMSLSKRLSNNHIADMNEERYNHDILHNYRLYIRIIQCINI